MISIAQLRDVGLRDGGIEHRVRQGRLHQVLQGVYAVGTPTLTGEGHRMAAVLTYGADAVNSHRTAAAMHDLRPTDQRSIDVTVPRRGIRSRDGVRVHSTTFLDREPPDFRSKFEREFYALIRRAGLPAPQTNVIVEEFRADCYWPQARLVVELDTHRFHSDASAFERDRREGNVLQRLNYTPLRFTRNCLKRDPQGIVNEIEFFLRPLPA